MEEEKINGWVVNNEAFYSAVSKDITQVLVLFLSERGHGKSSSLKSIVQRCMKDHPEIVWKAVDPSQTWFHNSPLKYRQYVTREGMKKGLIKNVNNCVYEVGILTVAERRAFIGMIIAQDYQRAYNLRMNDPEGFKALPWTVYIVEEANTVFGSYSFTAKDAFSPILNDFVSVGRNFKLGAFLVGTAEDGEMAPSLRRRSRRIYGRLEAEGDLARIKRKDKALAHYLAAEIPRFHFVYYADKVYGPVRVPDDVKNIPVDYIPVDLKPHQDGHHFNVGWLQILIYLGIIAMFIAYFLQ